MPRPAIIAVGLAAVLALVAALVLPQLLPVPPSPDAPLVADMFTKPEIAWSADGGQPCYPYLDENHAVLTGTDRVQSIDLRDGTTAWSLDVHGTWVEANCLPNANLVAVAEKEYESDEVLRITLIDGSTGEEVAEFSGESTVQVMPLGPHIGLLDRSNMLRAISPKNLDLPLWSRRLPGAAGKLGYIFVQPMDAASVMLGYAPDTDSGEGDGWNYFRPVLSVEDGKSPPWFQWSETNQQFFSRAGAVMIWFHEADGEFTSSVVDLRGRELWSLGESEPVAVGARLYVASQSDRSESGFKDLREVDPRTGTPIGDDVFHGQFDYAIAAPDGHLAVVEYNSLRILDEHLLEQATVPSIEYGDTFNGKKLLYLSTRKAGAYSTEKQLMAVDPSGSRVLWSLDLKPGQEIRQMGRHLVVVDDSDSAIHGLSSTS